MASGFPPSPPSIAQALRVQPAAPQHTFEVTLVDGTATHQAIGWGIDPSGALCFMSEGPVKVIVAYAAGEWVKVRVVE